MVGTKVFVGNLNFKTTEADLANAFSSAGKVVKVNIITRGPRSLGYGFVEFENDAVAEAAVKALDKKDIDGRPINVEVARPKQEKPAQGEKPAEGEQKRRQRRPRVNRKVNNNNSAAPSTAPAPSTNNNNINTNAPTGAVGKQEVSDKPRPRRPRRPRRPIEGNTQNGNNNNTTAPVSTNTNNTRPPRAPKVHENRLPSDTTIFVANLAWSVENNAFAAFLTHEGIKFKNAYVVKRRNGSSRGYGFVEFDSAADQKVALEKLDKKQYEGRELAVKVALAQPPKPAESAPPSTN